jgi:phosphoenolpyruvate synthase/pyruvate phosphate dikinase
LLSGKLKKEFQPMLDNVELELILEKLFLMRKGEWIHILGTGLKSESILGGKGFGLEFLLQADREHDFSIPCGIEITSEAITDLLYENTALRQLIVALDQEKNPDTKLAFACQIRRMIKTLTLDKMVTGKIKRFCQKTGQTSFAVRSSSADEDNFEKIGNTNAGIHETILDVNEDEVEKAILECLQSFFGEKAIRMRHLIKASNMPSFAILIQPMIKGVSGIAFSRDLHSVQEGCIVEVGKNAGDVTDSGSNVTHISFDGAMWNVLWGDPGIITHENLDKIKATLEKIEQLRGEDIDLEWVIDQQGKLWVLQSRALPPQKNKSVLSAEKPQGSVFIISKDTDISVLETCIASEQIPVTLRIEGFDLGSFQGCLFSLITKQSRKISQVITDRPFPRTGHFANICGCLGINILSIPG